MNCLDIAEDCSQATRAELYSCDRDHMAYKAKTLFCLAVYEKVGQSLVQATAVAPAVQGAELSDYDLNSSSSVAQRMNYLGMRAPSSPGREGTVPKVGFHETGIFFTPAVESVTFLRQLAVPENSCKPLATQLQFGCCSMSCVAPPHPWTRLLLHVCFIKRGPFRRYVLLAETK